MHSVNRRRSPRPALSLALAALLWLGLASGARAGISEAVKSQTLPNGLRVLVLENHKAPVATFNVFYRVGSRNEQFGKTGISHLCEHLMFRGTKKYGPEEFSNIIQENGGMDNAFTGSDFTDYFEVINHEHLDVPIGLEADRMANFAPKGFDAERAVVAEERRMRTDDNPEDALGEVTQAQAFIEHPYHWPVIGWMQDIQRLTLDDALKYHAVYYSPQNALVVVVGDFDANKVLKQVAESFSPIKNGPNPPPVVEVEPPQQGERRIVLRHAANLPAFGEAYHVPNYRTNAQDAFALEVLSELLSDGKSSRLYKAMVLDKRMVVEASASYDMTTFDPGLFWVSAQMRPGVKTEDAIAEADRVVEEMKAKPVGAEELQKAKNLEQAAFVFGQDSIFAEALQLGVWEMLGDYHLVDRYLAGIDKVSAADVQRVAKKYLVKSNCTLGVLVPTGVLPHQQGGGGPGGPVHHAPALPAGATVAARAPSTLAIAPAANAIWRMTGGVVR
ncbi:MAG TPA: pitrilysin family protein [Candidatus Binataceae bacterium]|nr:pitrilysin family protein [Candidatus Binataceae bacterium]